ncbi:MAG: UDP-3-O-acyl-N-acetylglucosamine deacetylase, partial [Bryobacterales bacterium]|nr:UDP-3-O-acyl-N-acetylglucosamine deacetylase [Bryobacterales bacterium]
MRFECTLRKPVSARGVGLHSGVPVFMTLRPAPAGTGIVFRRTDLDSFEIPAAWKYVAKVSYATSLMRKGVLISTIEHLMSVLASMGVDNAYVDIDNLEVPILDGSGLPFVRMIEEAGLRSSRRLRKYLRIVRPVSVEDKGKKITILPAHALRVNCEVYFDHPLVSREVLDLEITREGYAREIAPARTFGFSHELDAMRQMGLIRGASLENAVCFTETSVMNDGGLRFPDEPCRHKVLDLIGDFALLGR